MSLADSKPIYQCGVHTRVKMTETDGMFPITQRVILSAERKPFGSPRPGHG